VTGSPSCNHLYVLKDPCPCTSPVVLLLRDTWTLHSSCHCGCQRCIVCLLLAGSSVVRGQTEGKGSKQKQREKKDSRTTSYTIHNVYVFEKLCQLLAMKILEKKAMVLNSSQHSCEIFPAPHFKNKWIDNLTHKSYVTSQGFLIKHFKIPFLTGLSHCKKQNKASDTTLKCDDGYLAPCTPERLLLKLG